jgi:uracil-DNA glycosylase family 4
MFTGDGSGVFLYRALYKAGFANQAETLQRGDGLRLTGLYISAVCRCAPPQNKPSPQEIRFCLPFLRQEMDLLTGVEGVVCLGKIAFDHTLGLYRQQGHALPRLEFAHGAFFTLGADLPWLLASYHPSRQNTQTGRLTEPMFDAIWQKARELLA